MLEELDERGWGFRDYASRQLVARMAVLMRAEAEEAAVDGYQPATRAIRELQALAADGDGLGMNLTAGELAFIQSRPGRLDPMRLEEALWASESAAVIAWALGLMELPQYDEPANIDFIRNLVTLESIFPCYGDVAGVKPRETVEALARQTETVCWRVDRQRDGLDGEELDYAKKLMARAFDLGEIVLADGDLSLCGIPCYLADEEELERAYMISSERLRALNWLLDISQSWDEVSVEPTVPWLRANL